MLSVGLQSASKTRQNGSGHRTTTVCVDYCTPCECSVERVSVVYVEVCARACFVCRLLSTERKCSACVRERESVFLCVSCIWCIAVECEIVFVYKLLYVV